jgi:hypothetical protein
MTVFPIDIPCGGCVITAERDHGLYVDLEGCELDARAQTCAVLHYFATRRKCAYDVMFSVSPSVAISSSSTRSPKPRPASACAIC